MLKNNPKISIIIPVKNEAGILGKCLDSLMKLDYDKKLLEIIISDGLSTDATKDIALSYGVKVVDNPRQIVSSGRNRGFEVAEGQIIAFTDADCTFDVDWLKNSVKYFHDEKVGGIGGLTMTPTDSSTFEKAIDFLFGLAESFRATSHRRSLLSACEVSDIPGCNAIYSREALEKVMPVDENLLTAEDVWMNFCLKNSGYKLLAVFDVRLWHHRRSSPRRFLRQIYRFAIGRAQVGKRIPKLLNPLHVLMGFSLPLVLCLGGFFFFLGVANLFMKLILFFAGIIFSLSLARTRSFAVAINVIPVVTIFIIFWSAGFLRETFFPLTDSAGK